MRDGDRKGGTKINHIIHTTIKCPVCSAEMTAPKMTRTGSKHVKTMYCYVCKAERDFIQVDMSRTK